MKISCDKIKKRGEKNILDEGYHIAMTAILESEVMHMCNLSEGVWRKGVQDAMVDDIQKIMKNLKKSAAEAMDILEVPAKDREDYLELIAEQNTRRIDV